MHAAATWSAGPALGICMILNSIESKALNSYPNAQAVELLRRCGRDSLRSQGGGGVAAQASTGACMSWVPAIMENTLPCWFARIRASTPMYDVH